MSSVEPKSLSFRIQGKQFAGELWGDEGETPVIALHGWLDNCHSFRNLAPHLTNDCQLLAIDMAGHGHSEHRSADASYHIWDDVREVLMIANDMGWQQFALVGHSRGAIIASLVAAVAPERIPRLVLLEGLYPQTMTEEDAVGQLAKFVRRYLSFDGVEKGYKDIETMVEGRKRAGFGLDEQSARQLVERNVEYRDGYYYWLTDVRLTMPSPVMLTMVEAESFIKAIQCPVLLVVASEGMGKNRDFLLAKVGPYKNINVMILDGGHHLHMQGAIDTLARAMKPFLTMTK